MTTPPSESRGPRVYVCRYCRRRELERRVPRGWLTLVRHSGERDQAHDRLGVYCSLSCLARVVGRFARLAVNP